MIRLLALFFILISVTTENQAAKNQVQQESYLEQYTSHEDMLRQLKKLKVKNRVIGKSRSGKSIIAAQFGDGNSPALLVVGNVDGDYLVGTELAMNLISALKAGEVARNGKTIFVIPMPNPDATNFILSEGGYATRFNAHSTDDDHDLKTNEDGPNDLNNDGIISQLRIKDSTGLYSVGKENPDLLIKIDPLKNEKGVYRLVSEGKDDDGDKKIDEDGFGGVSINKNFTYNYDYFGVGSGVNQASEPETRALIDFVLDHKNILLTVNFSKYDNLHKNWSAKDILVKDYKKPLKAFEKMPKEDLDTYKLFSNLWNQSHDNWKVDAKNRGQGAFHDWAYFHAGRWSIAANGWNYQQIDSVVDKDNSEQNKVDKSTDGKSTDPIDNKYTRLFSDAFNKGLKDAIAPWEKINHPDFLNEEVEVGGFNSVYEDNPDHNILSKTKSSEFVGSLTELFPKLKVNKKIEKVAKELYRVTLTIKNIGQLPTQSSMAVLSRWMLPVRVEWNLSKERFVSGTKRSLLEPLDSLGGTQELSWLINTKDANKTFVEISSPVINGIKQSIRFEEKL